MTANNASESEWKLPEAPFQYNTMTMTGYITYAARLRAIAEEEHRARVEAENHLLAADVMLQEMVKRAEVAEADNARLRTLLERSKYAGYGHDHWDQTMRRGAGCPLCIERREMNDEIDAALKQPLRAESRATTQQLIRDAAVARAEAAEAEARRWYLPDGSFTENDPDHIIRRRKLAAQEMAELRAEVERLRKLEEIVKVGRYQFNDLHGKTLIDFLNLWLDQEKDKCQRLQADLAAAREALGEVREALESKAESVVTIQGQVLTACELCTKPGGSEPQDVAFVDFVHHSECPLYRRLE